MGRDWGENCIDKENGKYVTMMVVQEHSAQKKTKIAVEGAALELPPGLTRPGPCDVEFSFSLHLK